MGQSASAFCSPREPDSNDQQCCRPRSRHCPAASPTLSDAKGTDANAGAAASAQSSRNLLVIVDDEDSPIKKLAEYAKSPTVAERIEQEVEDELRQRRQHAEEEIETKEKNTNASEKRRIAIVTPIDTRENISKEIEHRDDDACKEL